MVSRTPRCTRSGPARASARGTVSGTRTDTFMLPWDLSFALQIEIDLLASVACTTPPIVADPGDMILVEIRQGLRNYGY
jgi:hypothetical protein